MSLATTKKHFFLTRPQNFNGCKKKKIFLKFRFENHLRPKQNVFSKNSRRTPRTTRKNIFLRSLLREPHYKQVQKNKYNFIKVKKMFFQITPALCLLRCNRKRGCSLRMNGVHPSFTQYPTNGKKRGILFGRHGECIHF